MSALKKALAQSAGKAENPLRVLGFGHRILTIGLTPDEIYEFVQGVAKRILGKTHSDVSKTERDEGTVQAVIAAMQALQVRPTFDRALGELGNQQSEILGEMATTLEGTKRSKEEAQRLESDCARLRQELAEANEKDSAAVKAAVRTMRANSLRPADARRRVNSSSNTTYRQTDSGISWSPVMDAVGLSLVSMSIGRVVTPRNVNIQELYRDFDKKIRGNDPRDKHYITTLEDIRREAAEAFAISRQALCRIDTKLTDTVECEVTIPVHWDMSIAQEGTAFQDVGLRKDNTNIPSSRTGSKTRLNCDRGVTLAYFQALRVIADMAVPGAYFDEFHFRPVTSSIISARISLADSHSSSSQQFTILGCVDGEVAKGIIGSVSTTDEGVPVVSETWLATRLQPQLFVGGILIGSEPIETGPTRNELRKVLDKPIKPLILGVVYDIP